MIGNTRAFPETQYLSYNQGNNLCPFAQEQGAMGLHSRKVLPDLTTFKGSHP